MKCYKQPLFNIPEPITSVWEVILDYSTWEKIVTAARLTNTTYSWVVRYCVLTVLEDPGILKSQDFRSVKPCSRNSGHRHHLCLYGDDEKHLKLIAVQLNIPVSKIIRFALALLLATFIRKKPTKSTLRVNALKKVHSALTTYKRQSLYRSLQETIFIFKPG